MNKPVSFEIAKLLKEKRFDEISLTLQIYREVKGKGFLMNGSAIWNENEKVIPDNEWFHAPTIAEVVMWLYEKHRIWIDANFLPNVDKFSYIAKPMDFKKPKEFSSYKDYYAATSKFIAKSKYDSPTEAYEAAILYCLENLI